MKKSALLTAIASLCLVAAHAQLKNSSWKGTILIPADTVGTLSPFGVTWKFTADTATLAYDNPEMVSDVMTYKTSGNKIMMKKVSGGVPCNPADLLTCTYSIKNDQLSLKMVSDDCKPRSHVDASQPFTRVK